MREIVNLQQSVAAVATFEALVDCFGQFIGLHGFHAFTLGIAPLRKGKIDSSGAEVFSTLPVAVRDQYRTDRMETFDPVFELMASRYVPYTKSSITPLFRSGPKKQSIIEIADEHDIGDAWMISMSTADFSRGVALFSHESADDFRQRIEQDGALLHIAGIAMMARAEALGFGKTALPDVVLTERETESLQWYAQGKTNQEIAAAMGITERTVRFHIRNACEKLGATRRARAVTLAVQHGLIRV